MQEKNLEIEEHNVIQDFSIKRSYSLQPTTYKKLKELKLLADEHITYNEIIDQAICDLYDRQIHGIIRLRS